MVAELVGELRARRGDTTSVEVKSAAGGCPTLGPTLAAFGNMPEGGTIVLGLDEEDGFTPAGLNHVATLEQGVAAQARDAVNPPVSCTFETVRFEGKSLLICDVAGLPLANRPARYGGQAYLRQSDGDYVMSEQEVAQVELLKTQAFARTRPDRDPVPGTSTSDLDDDLTRAYLKTARSASPRNASVPDEELLRRTGVLTSGGALTLAGLYALGAYPQQFHPSLSITAAVHLPRGAGSRTRDLAHFDGPLPDLLDQAMEWVRRNTHTTMGYDDRGHGVDRAELPMRAVREIIANALVHRNLDAVTDSKRVEIRLLDDKLVVTSPGGLWGVSEQQLGQPDGKSAVNLSLYDICKLVRMPDGSRVIEGEGGGIREARLALRDAGLRQPTFIDTGVRFTALMSRHTLLDEDDLQWLGTLRSTSPLTSEQRAILASMRRGEEWTNARVRTTFAPMDSMEARRLLQQLIDEGLATMVGNRRSATYHLSDDFPGARRADEPADLDRLSKNARAVWLALTAPMTLRELVAATDGLTERQVRYALTRLRDAGHVTLDGAVGDRNAPYRRQGDGLW